MYLKRLTEIFVQKTLLLFEILSFEVYCSSDSDLLIQGVGDFFNFPDIKFQGAAWLSW
jgi:hypothetical protein